MMEFLHDQFDKLFLLVVFGAVLFFCWHKPDLAKEWVGMVIGAILMLLTGRVRPGNGGANGETKP